jgi:hypothetical protein
MLVAQMGWRVSKHAARLAIGKVRTAWSQRVFLMLDWLSGFEDG